MKTRVLVDLNKISDEVSRRYWAAETARLEKAVKEEEYSNQNIVRIETETFVVNESGQSGTLIRLWLNNSGPFFGVALLHPEEDNDLRKGARLALHRALEAYFADMQFNQDVDIVAGSLKINALFRELWHEWRIAEVSEEFRPRFEEDEAEMSAIADHIPAMREAAANAVAQLSTIMENFRVGLQEALNKLVTPRNEEDNK